jgi:hypothetical protein
MPRAKQPPVRTAHWRRIRVETISSACSVEQFLPNPQDRNCTNYAEDEVGKIALAQQFYVQQITDKSAGIAANDTYEQVHAASLTLTAHNTVGNVADEYACEYRPRSKYYDMVKHNFPLHDYTVQKYEKRNNSPNNAKILREKSL